MAKQTFGAYLRTVLDQNGMHGNQLAKAPVCGDFTGLEADNLLLNLRYRDCLMK